MKNNKILLSIIPLLLFSFLLYGCASTPDIGIAKFDSVSKQDQLTVSRYASPSVGKARIIFQRKTSMLGLATTHIVVERGKGAKLNGVIFQKYKFKLNEGNFSKMANIKEVYWRTPKPSKDSFLILGRRRRGDFRVTKIIKLRKFQEGFQRYIEKKNDINTLSKADAEMAGRIRWNSMMNSSGLEPNVHIVSIFVDAGNFVSWERLPGVAKIEVITSGGDQAFALPFAVESGYTYLVDYLYASSKFIVRRVASQ